MEVFSQYSRRSSQVEVSFRNVEVRKFEYAGHPVFSQRPAKIENANLKGKIAVQEKTIEQPIAKPSMTGKINILLVEDNEDFAFGITTILRKAGMLSTVAPTLSQARTILAKQIFDVILLDLTLPDASGVGLISELKTLQAQPAIIVLTGRNDAEQAVKALRLGAFDYLTKPIRKVDLLKAIQTASGCFGSQEKLASDGTSSALYVIGDSPAWKRALDMIHAVAEYSQVTVLFTGEPGVGKEVGVQLLHKSSQRAEKPLLAVNVACLPANLLESELFGHEAGAFTGAKTTKKGLFEQADGGTLFFDEIGELPLELQAKLLRVLEGKPFRRIGGEKDIQPNVRVISATNRDLQKLIQDGRFRKDLYHRLKVVEIQLPPLKERGQDVEKLAMHFLARMGKEMGHNQAHFAPEVLPTLQAYQWPGNVRELRNVIERALVLSKGHTITNFHLPHELVNEYQQECEDSVMPEKKVVYASSTMDTKSPLPQSPPWPSIVGESDDLDLEHADLRLDVLIEKHIKRVLNYYNGNISRASDRLGITRQTLRRRLKASSENAKVQPASPAKEKWS